MRLRGGFHMNEEIRNIKGVPHKKVVVSCPDGIKGCAVLHFKWIPVNEKLEKMINH